MQTKITDALGISEVAAQKEISTTTLPNNPVQKEISLTPQDYSELSERILQDWDKI